MSSPRGPMRFLVIVLILLGMLIMGLPVLRIESVRAQQSPTTEVFLVALASAAGQPLIAGPLINISSNPGYDNQPSFLPDSSALLFTSNRDGKQTDIYRSELRANALTQLTNTPENEYSALVTPDGKGFSVVRGAEQELWRFDLDGKNPQKIYAHPGKVGYHVWISPTELAVFILGSPATLRLVNLTAGTTDEIARNVGRCLLMRPGRGTVSFVAKPKEAAWTLKELDPKTRATTSLSELLEGSEDLAWFPAADGRVLMAQKTKLFACKPGIPWVEVADLAAGGVEKITRLSISPNGRSLAFVAQLSAAPGGNLLLTRNRNREVR